MVTYIHRVFVASLHVIITAVSHSIGTELTITQHEERPVLILQRKVHTDSPRCTVCTTLTKINLIFRTDPTVAIGIFVSQITRHQCTTDTIRWKALLQRVLDGTGLFILGRIKVINRVDANAVVTPDGIERMSFFLEVVILLVFILRLPFRLEISAYQA